MPLGKKVRAASASAQLETLGNPSILADLVSGARHAQELGAKTTGPELRGSRVPPDGRQVSEHEDSEVGGECPEWLEREMLRDQRRHTVSLGNVTSSAQRHRRIADSIRTLYKLKIEEKVSLENLTKLKAAFEECEKDSSKSVDVTNFRKIVKKCLGVRGINDEQIQELFVKIDYLGNGSIRWDDFCTYIHLEYTEKVGSVLRGKKVEFSLPASNVSMCHGEPVLRIRCSTEGTIVTIREDGSVCYWTPELQLKKSRMVFQERPVNRKPKWATDFVIMPQYNKLIVGTGDREIQYYEFSSLEPYCQLSSLETVPLTLDYCYTGSDECVILYGDTQGCVNIILMTQVGETLRTWKKLPKAEDVPSITIDSAILSPSIRLIRWKVHEDWVNEARYFSSTGTIISASNNEATALVIGCLTPSTNLKQQTKELREAFCEGRPKKATCGPTPSQHRSAWDQTVFSIYKGVKSFDFSGKRRLLVTGGLDRLIRLWNPYVPGKHTGVLKGHCAPIFYLCISSEDSRIFSVSMDNAVKVWDIHSHSCLFTAHPKASLLRGDVTACLFSPAVRALYTATTTDSLSRLSLKARPQPRGRLVVSHHEPVLCCGYSDELRQVVSATEGSVVKVWDLDTGTQAFEFGAAHGSSAVSCLTFDPQGRRLVTGGRDGCLKVWNFNNGHCIKIFRKDGESAEVCDCTYFTANKKSYVMSVGWDRRIDVYFDSPEDLHHVQKPQPSWPGDLRRGHKDDILCMASCPPSLLATGSYDGEVIVWNLVSGHLYCRLGTPPALDCVCSKGDAPLCADVSVLCVLFLGTRALNTAHTSAACLLSSGTRGYINFWSVQRGGNLVASFEASRMKHQITKMAVSRDESWLYAADEVGYVYVFDIKAYALGADRTWDAPKSVNYWRAHISTVTGLQVIDREQVLLTSSIDYAVRLWSIHGEFIGTFGQAESWSLTVPSSWKHPAVPYEVLVDPLSMPCNWVAGEHGDSEAVATDTKEDSKEVDDANGKLWLPRLSVAEGDVTERPSIRPCYPAEPGKRLRHEIFRHSNKVPNHGGPKAYRSLKCFEIAETPTVWPKPEFSLAGTVPFASTFVEDPATESQ